MSKSLGAAVVAVLLLSATCASAGSLEAYGRLPALSDVEISADGANLAYIVHDRETARVVIQPLDGAAAQSVDFGRYTLRYGQEQPIVRDYKRYFAVASASDDKLEARSPVRHAAEADGPVLLIHGKDDTVVPFDQSTDMRRALERAGKPVEFVTLSAEDHWLSRETTRQQMLTAVVTFLEKNNPPN